MILVKTKEERRDVNMQCKKKKSNNNINNNSEKMRKERSRGEGESEKKRLEFFPHHPMCTGKIKEIRRSSVGSKCA